jgi:alanine racemase
VSDPVGPLDAALAAAGLPPLARTAWISVDLDRFRANLVTIRRALPAGCRIDVVLKADGYGHGALPLARVLETGPERSLAAGPAGPAARAGRAGAGAAGTSSGDGAAAPLADGIAVATFDEARELRDGGIRLPILVLFPIPPALAPEAARRRIAITASDPVILERTLAAVAAAAAGGARGPTLQVHLEVETGLGRAGIAVERVRETAARIAAARAVRLVAIWSHLQSAVDHARSGGQDERFVEAARLLADGGFRIDLRHLAASGGVLTGSAPAYEGVRIGLAAYGLLPDGLSAAEARRLPARSLRPILSLRARPIRVADLPAGAGISYGPSFVTGRPSRIATLPLGYGDGIPRSISNRAEALVRGRRVPLVGTVAMDALMADVTDVPGPPVGVDDEFVLIGVQGSEEITVADLARLRTTIPWEVVTDLSRRLARVYHAGSVIAGVRSLASR